MAILRQQVAFRRHSSARDVILVDRFGRGGSKGGPDPWGWVGEWGAGPCSPWLGGKREPCTLLPPTAANLIWIKPGTGSGGDGKDMRQHPGEPACATRQDRSHRPGTG
jgi:hypothetical protein